MGKYWMIDVLTDLRSFAAMNDLATIAAKIDETIAVARSEFGMIPEPALMAAQGDIVGAGPLLAGSGTRGRA